MTTYTYTGFRITLSGSTATAAAFSTFSMTNTDSYLFKYALDGVAGAAAAGIHVASTIGANYKTVVGTTTVAFDTAAYVAQYTWGGGKVSQALIFKVPGETNVINLFQLGGASLPVMDTAAKYNAFISSVTLTSGTITGTSNAPGDSLSPNSIHSPVVISYNDTLIANATFDTWGPTKTILVGSGNDRVDALETNDKIDLGSGNDTVFGHGGNDTLMGNVGNDNMSGEVGADSMSGGSGIDVMNGGSENDRMDGGTGNDTMYGSTGNDYLDGSSDNDSLSGSAGADTLNGNTGNDSIDGGTENDSLIGGSGNDSIYGGAHNDVINAGAGIDLIYGGDGNDMLTGGTEADDFYFAKTQDSDKVTDFQNDVDQLLLNRDLGITSVTAALSHATQVGTSVVFDFGNGDILTVQNILKAALSNDIVLFG